MPRPRGASLGSLLTSESGIALVVLLVVALFVALVGVAMTGSAVTELQSAGNERTGVQARYLAEAGIADAANHLAADNTWTGPVTQTLGAGSYTVQLDTTRSQSGSRGAVKSVVSTGTVLAGSPAAASQTIRLTFLVVPQAFSKAALSNTTLSTCAAATCDTGGYTPAVTNNVLRQLGTLHANNVVTATTAISLAAATTVTGGVTARNGTITTAGICIACAAATNQPKIPFPLFDYTHYITMAQNNPSPCGAHANPGTLFTTQAEFDTCVGAMVTDTSGFRNFTGTVFINSTSTINIPNTAAEQKLKINGSFFIWGTGPFGDFNLNWARNPFTLVFTSQNGEPALVTGGQMFETGAATSGSLTINGLVYVLDYTNNPVAAPACPGFDLPGSSTNIITIKGLLLGQNLGCSGTPGGLDTNVLTYDPSSFFGGLPSGLLTPTNLTPFVLLPISWSSAK